MAHSKKLATAGLDKYQGGAVFPQISGLALLVAWQLSAGGRRLFPTGLSVLA
ncbi:MAG: hypothetical protein ACWA6Y_12570 [Polaromonas sp.]